MKGKQRAAATLLALAATGIALRKFQPDTYQRIQKLVISLLSSTYNGCIAFAGGMEITAILLKDLAQYLKSDDDELPASVLRVFALLRSRDFLNTYQSFVSTSIDGFMESEMGQKLFQEDENKQGALDKIITALLSEPGQNLVGLAVKMATQTTVETFAQSVDLRSHVRQSSVVREVLDWLNTPRAQQLVSHTTTAAVATGVTALMEQSAQNKGNQLENLLSALSQPQHAEVTRQLLQAVIREAITTAAIQIKNNNQNNNNNDIIVSPRSSRAMSPARDKRALSVPDIQLVNSMHGYKNNSFDNSMHQQISQGLAAIGSHREARELMLSMAGQVTGSGVRSMVFSVLDVLKGRGEFEGVLEQQQKQQQLRKQGVAQSLQNRVGGLGISTSLTLVMALFLHISMFPVPYLQQV